jgi:hypothetical protein
VRAQLVPEPARLLQARGGERAQLVGMPRRRFPVADDHETHRGQDSLATVDELVERYLRLGLHLGRHVEGFVDAYYGPPELAEGLDVVPPGELAREAAELGAATPSAYLRAQLAGCETTARRLAGEELRWADEVEGCYGVRPDRTSEDVFAGAQAQLDAALPGDGDVGERYREWAGRQSLPVDRLIEAARAFESLLRERTRGLVGLPEGGGTELEAVHDEPWSAFNYYLGGRRSRVVINTDLPVYSFRLPELVAHELYPGHHTERAWKEALLVDGEGRFEESIMLTGTPQAVVSEGIASLAPELAEAAAFAPEVYAELGVDYEPEVADAVRGARSDLEGASVNAALLLHVDGRPADEVVDYLERWTLVPRVRAEKTLEFITHPTWRAYVCCYTSGYELCKRWVAGDVTRFRSLLTEQLSTHDLLV